MSKVMQRLTKQAQELEDDEILDYGTPKPIYGSSLFDVIILNWQDLESPWEWVRSDPRLTEEFKRTFTHNAKNQSLIKLYRGTDWDEYLNLAKGDTLNYSERYTSWSTDINVAVRFMPSNKPILLIYEGPMVTFDLTRTNRNEKEHIIGPSLFTVNNVLSLGGSDDIKEQCTLVNEALSSAANVGSGKIITLIRA